MQSLTIKHNYELRDYNFRSSLRSSGLLRKRRQGDYEHPSWPSYFEARKVFIEGVDVTQLFVDYIGFDEVEEQVMEKYYS